MIFVFVFTKRVATVGVILRLCDFRFHVYFIFIFIFVIVSIVQASFSLGVEQVLSVPSLS